MNVGMLWLEHERTSSFAAMIANAAGYYQKKYGQVPDLCFVHPSMLETAGPVKDDVGIVVKPDKTILPGLLWIGVEDKLPARVG